MGAPIGARHLHRASRVGAVEAWRRRPGGVRIETERLVLRPYTPHDFEALHAMSASPDMWTYSERGPMAPEESWARLLRHAGHWMLRGYGVFAVEEKATGQLVGETGFSDFHRSLGEDFDPFPEACWTVRSDRQGRGYATEAAAAALRWVGVQAGAERTVCLIHARNLASCRVAAKLGFRPFREVHYRGYRALLLCTGEGGAAQGC